MGISSSCGMLMINASLVVMGTIIKTNITVTDMIFTVLIFMNNERKAKELLRNPQHQRRAHHPDLISLIIHEAEALTFKCQRLGVDQPAM